MHVRYLAILALWIVAAVLSAYSALALHSFLLAVVSFILATAGTVLLSQRPSVGTLSVVHETMEDQLVESSLGFSVQMTPASLVYREGTRSLTILPFTEPGRPAMFRMAWNIPLAWEPPNESTPIPAKRQEEIRHRIGRCIAFLPSAQLSWKQKHALRKLRKEMRTTAEKTPIKK